MKKLMYAVLAIGLLGCASDKEKQEEKQSGKERLVNVQESMSVGEFVNWCSDTDNELRKSKTVSEMTYYASFLPSESMAYLELKSENYTIDQFKKVSNSYQAMSYFNFRLQLNNGTGELLKYGLQSPGQYEERLKYISFQMDKDLYIVQGNDTVYPGLYHFERAYEVVPYLTVMMGFDNKQFDKEKEFTLVYNDKLFGKGLIKFTYQNMQLVDVPQVIQL